ncbi:unnamed protein product [Calicophoron daubneyi]|uniref:[histone H3]-trimethyl-L-lysine(4) demethylase n=1 Tax=Calicophoron daubneyi TaxID=300641 RepID=A0AAV2TMS9_CALDB
MSDSGLIELPEARVFYPSVEEFKDALGYINHIAPLASQYGICKIHPPQGWSPPFCADPMLFSFYPRVQHLSDISAYNRVRNNFITSLVNFWEAQEVTISSPFIKDKCVDIFQLWKAVQSMGGYENVCNRKTWCEVCLKMGFEAVSSMAASVSSKYKKILLPYETFQRRQTKTTEGSSRLASDSKLPSKRKVSLRKLICSVCSLGTDEDHLLLCDGCDTVGACHIYCLNPPLSDIPKGRWFCARCVAQKYKTLQGSDTFGFVVSTTKRTLDKFGVYADEFKARHFGKPNHMVSLEEAEAEFWRLVNSEDSNIVVEYGADLNSRDHGSGFPFGSRTTSDRRSTYLSSPWNLNNLSTDELSALRYLPQDISGMVVPWCYVGMIFSCFCWHTEDHWSCSINYLHRGSPKTWYGVPGFAADAFELTIRSEVPELFEASPDLLHHMTTMFPPSVLKAHGVPVYHLNQMAGEFVVTFPRSYHAGFNQGFNFAEAVNFCPAFWFEFGQNCIEHYALIHRSPVFSHAELLCRFAQSEEPFNVEFLAVITKQLQNLLLTERTLRRHLARLGVRRTERLVFEDSDDEKRDCELCKTTLYLSALTCKCSPTMVCLAHHQARTCCPREEQVMRYRYGLDELSEFIDKLQSQLDEYRRWKQRVDEILSMFSDDITTTTPVQIKLDNELPVADTSPAQTTVGPKDDRSHSDSDAEISQISSKPVDENDIGQTEDSTVSDERNHQQPDSQECKTEECGKVTLDDLKTLITIGQSRHYPKSSIDSLNQLVCGIARCSVVVHDLLDSFRTACVKLEEQTESIVEDLENAKAEDRTKEEKQDESEEDEGNSDSDSTSIDSSSDTSEAEDTPVEPKDRSAVYSTRTRSRRDRGSPSSVTGIGYDGKAAANRPPRKGDSSVKRRRGPVTSKLTLDEFQKFFKLTSRFEIFLPEVEELRQFNDRLSSWRQQVHDLLSTMNAPQCATQADHNSSSSNNLHEVNTKILTSLSVVDSLLKFAEVVSVDLPETVPLKRVRECLIWMEMVEKLLNFTKRIPSDSDCASQNSRPSLDRLCELQLQGDLISSAVAYVTADKNTDRSSVSHESVPQIPMAKTALDVVLANCSRKLLNVIYSAKLVEDRLLLIKNARPRSLHLSDIMKEVNQASLLPVWLPVANEIKALCSHVQLATKQLETIEKLLVSTPFGFIMPPLDPRTFADNLYEQLGLGTIECTSEAWKRCIDSLLDEYIESPIAFSNVERVRSLLNFVDQCRGRLMDLFVWPQSKQNLLEILLPRSAAALDLLINLDSCSDGTPAGSTMEGESSRASGLRRSLRSPVFNNAIYTAASEENAHEFAKALVACDDAGLLYDSVYRRLIDAELSLMHRLRSSNMVKSRAKKQNTVIYCICRKPGYRSFMVQCELCRDWFHSRCVALPNLRDSEVDRLRYICPRCECSMRPDLDQVLNILDDLTSVLPTDPQVISSMGSPSSPPPPKRVMCLLRLPEFVAVQLLCERAFLFIRRVRNTILSTPELHHALIEYERFAGVKLPLYSHVEEELMKLDPSQTDSAESSVHPRTYQIKNYSRSGSMCGPNGSRQPRAFSSSSKDWGHAGGSRVALPTQSSKSMADIETEQSRFGERKLRVTSNPRSSLVSSETEEPYSDEMTRSIYGSQDAQYFARKQMRKTPLLVRSAGTHNSPLVNLGEPEEAEAAEALAGMSASMLSQSSGDSGVAQSSAFQPSLRSLTDRRPFDDFTSLHGKAQSQGFPSSRSGTVSRSPAYMPVRGGPQSVPPLASAARSESSNRPLTSGYREPGLSGQRNLESSETLDSQKNRAPLGRPRKFTCDLSVDARKVLDALIMEACLLEVTVPQTRWLWQLHLASDSENNSNGAHHPNVAKAEEEKLRRRFLRHLEELSNSHPYNIVKQRRLVRPKPSEPSTEENLEDDAFSSKSEVSSSPDSAKSEGVSIAKRRRLSLTRRSDGSAASSASGTSTKPDNRIRRKIHRIRGASTSSGRRCEMGRGRRLQSTRRRPLHHYPYTNVTGRRIAAPHSNRISSNLGVRYSNPKFYRQRLTTMNKSETRSRGAGSSAAGARRRPRRGHGGERVLSMRDRNTENIEYGSESDNESNELKDSLREHEGMSNPRPRQRKMIRRSRHTGAGLLERKRDKQGPKEGYGEEDDKEEGSEGDEEPEENAAAEDECMAQSCIHPHTGTVEWIACDGCGHWFHQVCVGIHHRSQVPEVYLCSVCRTRSGNLGNPVRESTRSRGLHNRIVLTSRSSTSSKMRHLLRPGFPGSRAHMTCVAQRPVGWNSGELRSSSMQLSDSPQGYLEEGSSGGHDGVDSLVDAAPQIAGGNDQWTDYSPSPGEDELDSELRPLRNVGTVSARSLNSSPFGQVSNVTTNSTPSVPPQTAAIPTEDDGSSGIAISEG